MGSLGLVRRGCRQFADSSPTVGARFTAPAPRIVLALQVGQPLYNQLGMWSSVQYAAPRSSWTMPAARAN